MRSVSPVTESPCWPGRPSPTLVPWRHQDPIVLTYPQQWSPARHPTVPTPDDRRYSGAGRADNSPLSKLPLVDRSRGEHGRENPTSQPEGECTNGPAISGSQPVPKDGSAGSGSIGSVPIRQTPVASARAVRESERRASPWTSMQIQIRNRRSCHSNTLFHRPGMISPTW